MAQPAVLLSFDAVPRADGHTLDDVVFASQAAPIVARDDAWRPAKSLAFVLATCGAFWIAAAVAYFTLH
jgi:hypothetical protein